jgi:beta-keto acid cleavage enzyme
MDLTQMWTLDDIKGTHLEDPKQMAAWAGMYTDAGPAFYMEHLKRLKKNGIQPYFPLAHVHQLEIVERLIRHGAYMGPVNMAIATYGGGGCGYNPFDLMEFIRRTPQGAIATFWAPMRISAVAEPLAIILGQHVRVGNEDNLWNSKRERITTVQQVEAIVNLSQRFGRKVATAEEARKIMKVGVWYDSVEETLQNLGLPPNRAGGERGFMVWETDGKKSVAHAMSDSHPMAYCMVPPQQVAEVTKTS